MMKKHQLLMTSEEAEIESVFAELRSVRYFHRIKFIVSHMKSKFVTSD